MPKSGLKFDYDLKANEHVKKENKCLVCESELHCRWTDMNGEGVCLECGCPYQLINGSKEQIAKNEYPYINIKKSWISILKEYYNETQEFVFNGNSFSEDTGRKEFNDWIKEKHSEMIKQN